MLINYPFFDVGLKLWFASLYYGVVGVGYFDRFGEASLLFLLCEPAMYLLGELDFYLKLYLLAVLLFGDKFTGFFIIFLMDLYVLIKLILNIYSNTKNLDENIL